MLERRRARVHLLVPLVIRLNDREVDPCCMQPWRVKLDPGSKTTGMAVVREVVVEGKIGEIVVVHLLEIVHRGRQISEALTERRAMRRRRCGNQGEGGLAPSLKHRVESTMAWAQKLCRYFPLAGISMELVRFDLQRQETPEIAGVQYQQGTLHGYEVREYLLGKWNRTCAYCDAKDTPLQAEHLHARAKGGSDRIANLALACGPCNQSKGARIIAEFLALLCGYLTREKQVKGFQTGDLVLATVATGKKAGVHRGRVAVRKSGSFNIQTAQSVVEGINHRHCRVIQRGNGYGYFFNQAQR